MGLRDKIEHKHLRPEVMNPTGTSERADCVPLVSAFLFKTTLSEAIEIWSHHGRKPNGCTWSTGPTLLGIAKGTIANPFNYDLINIPIPTKSWRTLTKFIMDHPIGRYFILVTGHALAIDNGIIYDCRKSLGRKVNWAFEVVEKTNAK